MNDEARRRARAWTNWRHRTVEDWTRYQEELSFNGLPDDHHEVLDEERELVELVRARGAIGTEDMVAPSFLSGNGDGPGAQTPVRYLLHPGNRVKARAVFNETGNLRYNGHTMADPAKRREAARLGWMKRRARQQARPEGD